MNNIDVVYTPWSNLKKENHMVVGQVRMVNLMKLLVFIAKFLTFIDWVS